MEAPRVSQSVRSVPPVRLFGERSSFPFNGPVSGQISAVSTRFSVFLQKSDRPHGS
ncbi:hypothetical protein GMO_19660 [Gluconobacter morbifer G707]|uniref:Uncharacterized protein n=1 Tax=Gluconobacter morbifer G707 TaxID=1088869 RepID=G6XKF0_9PROT|nr:hypothetical protein GMO_19660 [Gluconobacter morbifer G707]